MPVETGRLPSREVIRAYHGVTSRGDWFLLADVGPARATNACTTADHLLVNEDWLVVLGRRDRDIITLQGQDA